MGPKRVEECYVNVKCSVKLMHPRKWEQGREKQENKLFNCCIVESKGQQKTEKPDSNKSEKYTLRVYKKV